MLKDFNDKNKDLITMVKGTDLIHRFRYIENSGSKFIWESYSVTCEGRFIAGDDVINFIFPVTKYILDDEIYGSIYFQKEAVNAALRSNRIYWNVIANHIFTHETKVINYGEILLKDA